MRADLHEPTLLRDRAFIAGQWVDSDGMRTFPVRDPFDGLLLAEVPDMGVAEVERAIHAASRALPAWRARCARERAAILRRWFDLMIRHQDDLARIMTLEQGKPLAEARGEVAYGASFVEWFSEEAKRAYGDVIPHPQPGRRVLVLRQPVGVVAAITPWNFPNAMITRKAGAALAAGCTLVVKPASATPLSALALARLGELAGLPEGTFNVVTGRDARSIGRTLALSPTVRKLSFTGSTEVGKELLALCAGTVKRVSLELGGNAPFLVFDDADLNAAVEGAIASKYRNSGQTCVCTNRLLVQDGVHDRFVERLARATAALRVGSGLDPNVEQGPLIHEDAVQKVQALVDDARDRGARIVVGGARHERGGTFFQPTLIAGATPEMRLAQEEIFGPVAPVFRFHTEAQAIELANATPYGLAAYFYARDLGRVWRVAEALEYGMVAVNEGILSTEVAPFGGMKESGLGREGSRYGLDEYLERKYVLMGGLGS